MRRVSAIGNVMVDLVVRIEALPERGADVIASSSATLVGGSGFNALVAAARAGAATRFAGAHGTGPFGDLARAALAREGIEVVSPRILELDTGVDVAIVDATGERTFITTVGAEALLSPAAIVALDSRADDIVVLSGYTLAHETSRASVIAALPLLDGVIVVDPGPLAHSVDPAVLDAVLARADWWSGNAREASLATGLDDARAASRSLAERVGRGAIVRRGAAGCIVAVRGAEPVELAGYDVDVVDANGAGDAHVGAFAAGLAMGLDPVAAAERANAVAAIAVTRSGPATAPTRAETDAFLAR